MLLICIIFIVKVLIISFILFYVTYGEMVRVYYSCKVDWELICLRKES